MFTLRPMTIDDYDAVRALWEATAGVGLDPSDEREPTARYLKRNPGLSLVAHCQAGRLSGAVLCGHDGRRGYLSHAAVAEHARGQGLGRLMADRCLAELASLGVMRCNVRIFADNRAAAAFWARLGFASRNDLAVMQRNTSLSAEP